MSKQIRKCPKANARPRDFIQRYHKNITPEFMLECETNFKGNKANILARNAITSVGSLFATINSNRVNEISYVFLNTIKKKNLKATNQGSSGRCWMFAALNTFRHVLIRSMNLDNFEFSEVYLFFYDKLERCNSFIQWFIENRDASPNDRGFEYMVTDYMGDGGWWNTFANLVNKYGLLPKSAMQETAASGNSEEMNHILQERLTSCVNTICNKNGSLESLYKLKDETMKEIYNTLVKFLGEPPKKFDWPFSLDEENGANIIGDLTPKKFAELVIPNIDMNRDFVTLVNMPTYSYNTTYRVLNTKNVQEGEPCTLFNLQINELAKYAMKSISSGIAVWFGGDVTQSFNWYHSALDDKLDDHETVFGKIENFSKGDRIKMRNVQGNHAMALTGFNIDSNGKVVDWQVENSWGYFDNETAGLDGFLTMSQSWFEKYVTHIVVPRRMLSRTLQRDLGKAPVEMNAWESISPATRTGVFNPPKNYLEILQKRRRG